MRDEKQKVVLIGTGFVGMSFAYALLNQNVCNELALIDVNRDKARGEAMDLNHGLAFSGANMRIYEADYDTCKDADIVVICAGVSQKPGEDRPALLQRNTAVFKSIVDPVVASGFSGIFLVATNPVDVMTHVVKTLSGFDSHRVIGTGTTLDTARLRFLLGEYFNIDPKNVHAYVIGEHGESEFVPWSQAMVGTKSVSRIVNDYGDRFKKTDMDEIGAKVKNAAQEIIAAKQSTYYGIGMALVRITKAIFGNENSILTVSSYLDGEYGQSNVYAGVPCVVGRNGVLGQLTLELTDEELSKMQNSCDILRQYYKETNL
ncbi:MAG TPA: L-lactate dehydrogenase [Clostridiales bacterium]|jgi:L-lactate dehydrogenase|uniref:L-lactate dehydrogenase n=1 Tax=Congzhengia minquanensis TaxID=2763657 RepID=A0A926HTS7_9FIRM|nr:L-lactate dehydrogenase [Congzhengia minquanensis]MBC8539852.1 L-lactate dehydrogenase [Congzhengia minquanensis]MBD8946727.1 L-lactate dehydrogenase [Clostridiales bacterium]HBL82924.1 L-lactate dehydrogenase [Clostridiales bacterium]